MKGQYFSFDAIIACVIFLLAVVALLSYWYSVKSFLDYQNEDLSKQAIVISNSLLLPTGPDCNVSTQFGLAMSWDDQRLNQTFLNCLNVTIPDRYSYNTFQQNFGLGYNNFVFINISTISSDTSTSIYHFGAPPNSFVPSLPTTHLSEVVNVRRLATLYNPANHKTTLAIVDVVLYR